MIALSDSFRVSSLTHGDLQQRTCASNFSPSPQSTTSAYTVSHFGTMLGKLGHCCPPAKCFVVSLVLPSYSTLPVRYCINQIPWNVERAEREARTRNSATQIPLETQFLCAQGRRIAFCSFRLFLSLVDLLSSL